MDENNNQQNDRCRLDNGHADNNTNNHDNRPMDSIDDSNNTHDDSNCNNNETTTTTTTIEEQQQVRPIPSSQDVHTREKLFDFIALLQGRRMDDQRAILKPSTSSTTTTS